MQKPLFKLERKIDEILRVNHAGEYGAKMIYQGQLSSIKNKKDHEEIKHMYKQELLHLKYFEKALLKRNNRPSIYMPLWHLGGYLLGKISAKMGVKQAMVCTDAVEEVINKHYEKQKIFLIDHPTEKPLFEAIHQFQFEEQSHQNIAQKHIDTLSLKDRILYNVISKICKIAIFASKKL